MAPAAVASRFNQLLSGHDMKAAFLCEKWGRTDLDKCWCKSRRQSREHLHLENGNQGVMERDRRGSRQQEHVQERGREEGAPRLQISR